MNSEKFLVQIPDDSDIRVDKFVASLGMFTRSQIGNRTVRVRNASGTELKMSRRLKSGEEIVVDWDDPPPSDIQSEELPLSIVYEDEDCVVVDKEQGIVVHPAIGNLHGTLVQGLLYRYRGLDQAFDGDRVRPGIVHRLDKDTSGLIVAAKNLEALNLLSGEFRNRKVEKTYIAITRGVPRPVEGEILKPIGRDPRDRKKFWVDTRNAKSAITRYRVLASCDTHAVVQVRIITGRTHQIRVHLKSLNTPILGDSLYGRKDPVLPDATLMLHSWRMTVRLPDSRRHRFEAAIPRRFVEAADRLGLPLPSQS